MLDMSMQVLKIVIENEGKTADEILGAISAAFPNKTYNTLKGYINTLGEAGYLSVQYGYNRICYIGVNPSAHAALDKAENTVAEPNRASFNIGQIHGQVAMGNSGGSYNFTMTNAFREAMSAGLTEAASLANNRGIDAAEREEIKQLLRQILASLRQSENPPQNLVSKLSALFQKHSWIAAPIATQALNLLAKFSS